MLMLQGVFPALRLIFLNFSPLTELVADFSLTSLTILLFTWFILVFTLVSQCCRAEACLRILSSCELTDAQPCAVILSSNEEGRLTTLDQVGCLLLAALFLQLMLRRSVLR